MGRDIIHYKYGTSYRKILPQIPLIIPIKGMKMQGDKMDTGPDRGGPVVLNRSFPVDKWNAPR
jgi:hypothetical protein